MYRETINHAGGTTEGTASEAHALTLLRRAAHRGYDVEATREGGALITWTALNFAPDGETVVRSSRSITLTPQMPVGNLTDTMIRDLAALDEYPHTRYAVEAGRRVTVAGFHRVPAFATARYRARGLLREEPSGRVRLSLTARLGLLTLTHRTRTTAPEGWHRPVGAGMVSAGLSRPGRRAGLLYSGVSAAVCSCGALAAYGDDRGMARLLARGHRQEVARAFILTELTAVSVPSARTGGTSPHIAT